ncbi:D-alanyl-D-alanine carboxypeptidase [Streptomyces sp. NBC_01317]|nr:D-alanyl-D-alanine carboxypeptidase [Streptomyces sp. NBC_01317]
MDSVSSPLFRGQRRGTEGGPRGTEARLPGTEGRTAAWFTPSVADSRDTDTPCTFSVVPALKKTALTVFTATLLPVLTVVPASADSASKGPSASKSPTPPAVMSTVGGARLGQAGTQVALGPGAPVLPKKLSGRSWIVADAETGAVLAAHNAHWRLPPASTLKMLFADTLLPRLPKDQEHKVVAADLAGMGDGSSLVGVKENLTYSVHDLWLGVFLRSGNDAVHVLSAMNNGVKKTVQDMQRHAEELQALDTTVVTPDGYDEKGQVSSAYDLTLFARSGLQKKDFREYCATQSAKFPGDLTKVKKGKKPEKDAKGQPKRDTFEIQNTNRLLTGANGVSSYKGLAGVKNGYTSHAGSTFTGVAERNGKVLLVTVMNPSSEESQAVYQESARLLDWGFAASGKVTPVGELVPPKSARTTASQPSGSPTPAPGATDTPAPAAAVSASEDGSGGMGIALAVVGGVVVLLAGAGYLVNRRWPSIPRPPRS